MTRRRERPLPNLPIRLEFLPPPEPKRDRRLMLSFTGSELAMIVAVARERREQPAVLARTIILTAFQNTAAGALADRPGLLEQSPAEQRKRLLEAFES
jgi:hypothetical protein